MIKVSLFMVAAVILLGSLGSCVRKQYRCYDGPYLDSNGHQYWGPGYTKKTFRTTDEMHEYEGETGSQCAID